MSSRISHFYFSILVYFHVMALMLHFGNIGKTSGFHLLGKLKMVGCFPPYVDLARIDNFVFLTLALTFAQGQGL
jgi:hypothetical protein